MLFFPVIERSESLVDVQYTRRVFTVGRDGRHETPGIAESALAKAHLGTRACACRDRIMRKHSAFPSLMADESNSNRNLAEQPL